MKKRQKPQTCLLEVDPLHPTELLCRAHGTIAVRPHQSRMCAVGRYERAMFEKPVSRWVILLVEAAAQRADRLAWRLERVLSRLRKRMIR